MRIVDEWKDYDNEIKKLQVKQSEHEDEEFSVNIQSKGKNCFYLFLCVLIVICF